MKLVSLQRHLRSDIPSGEVKEGQGQGSVGRRNFQEKLSIVQSVLGVLTVLGQEERGDALKEPLHSWGSLILVWGYGMGLTPGTLRLLEQNPFLRAPTEVLAAGPPPLCLHLSKELIKTSEKIKTQGLGLVCDGIAWVTWGELQEIPSMKTGAGISSPGKHSPGCTTPVLDCFSRTFFPFSLCRLLFVQTTPLQVSFPFHKAEECN